jgi:hypothetical protein
MFEEPALNTFSASQAAVRKQQGFHAVNEIPIDTRPLGEVLEKYLVGKDVSLLTIDAMDYDYEVLRSNNWDLFKPKLIIVHDDSGDLKFNDVSAALHTRTCLFLKELKYSLVAKDVLVVVLSPQWLRMAIQTPGVYGLVWRPSTSHRPLALRCKATDCETPKA